MRGVVLRVVLRDLASRNTETATLRDYLGFYVAGGGFEPPTKGL